MQIWSDNWTLSSSLVKISLSVQPSGPTAVFNSPECVAGFGTPACTIEDPGTPAAPKNLEADVSVPASSNAGSVTLSATVASPAGATLSAPLGAAGTAQVAGAGSGSTSPGSTSSSGHSSSPASHSSSSHSSSPSHSSSSSSLGLIGDGNTSSVGIGPIPELNNANTSLIGAGNAASLFPQINPSDSPSPVPGAGAGSSKGKADGSPTVSLLPLGMPVVTAQVVGLIALAIAFLLALTRISLRRRPGGR